MSRPYLVLLSLVLLSVMLQMIAPTVEGFNPTATIRQINRQARRSINDQMNSTQSQAKRFLRQNFDVMS